MKIKRFGAVALIVLAGFSSMGLGCKAPSAAVQEASKPVTLTWWRVFDDEITVRPIIESYQALHPNVTIVYRKLRYEEYERELLNALAEDRGPDIISLHTSSLRGYQNKVLPMPRQVTLPYQEVQGNIKKEVITTLRTTALPSVRDVRNNFVDAVVNDVILPSDTETKTEQVYGLPLGVDTLALFSNRDLLNLAGVPRSPQTWTELQSDVKKLTQVDKNGAIIQSGAALGTARNVERASDILALLMMQNGTVMIDGTPSATFDRMPTTLQNRPLPPGQEALIFYSDFANPGKEVYTWNAQMPGSLEAFVSGKTAFFLGYSYHLPLIKARAPKLNVEVSPAPQIEGNPSVNYANFFVETVSRKSKNPAFAWDFINFATSARQVGSYLENAKKPTALRALVAPQSEDLDIGIFVSEVLTARSWYRGMNAPAAEEALLGMIDAMHELPADAGAILRFGAQKVTQTLR